MVGLITGARTTGRRVPDLTLLIDARTLRHGRHDDTVCETGDGHPLPVETMRRHGCDAAITPITLDDDGVPLNVGRTRRLATPEQRRALRVMYRTLWVPGLSGAVRGLPHPPRHLVGTPRRHQLGQPAADV